METELQEKTERWAPEFAHLASEVERCGWRPAPVPAPPGELRFRTFQGEQLADRGLYANDADRCLLVIGLEQVTLPDDEDLFPRFLNLSLEARMAILFARGDVRADWLLLLTKGRLDLHRLPEEGREHRAMDATEFQAGLLPQLAGLARGRDETVRTGPSQLPGAESLRGWMQHWTLQLAPVLELPPDGAEKILWRWILMLQFARRGKTSEATDGWGLDCAPTNGNGVILSYDAQSATEDLIRALENFGETFYSCLFVRPDDALLDRLRGLEESSILDRLRAELLMQTQDRFEPETVAWLFTDLAREQQGWRHEVAGVEPVRRRLRHEGWTVYRSLTCDLERDGLTFTLRDAARLAHYLNDQMVFTQKRREEHPSDPVNQPDLFKQTLRGVAPNGRLDDPVNYMFAEALRIVNVPAPQRFGVGVVLLLQAMALAERLDWPLRGIDKLDEVFSEAPLGFDA